MIPVGVFLKNWQISANMKTTKQKINYFISNFKMCIDSNIETLFNIKKLMAYYFILLYFKSFLPSLDDYTTISMNIIFYKLPIIEEK